MKNDNQAIRDDILAIMRATGKPLRSLDIAIALSEWRGTPITQAAVAAHLGQMKKLGAVRSRPVAVGEPVPYGIYSFPEGGSQTVWFSLEAYTHEIMGEVRTDARRFKRFPKPVIPNAPVAHTDDMIQMLHDLSQIPI